MPAVCEAHWTKLGPSVADVTKGVVVLRSDHPTFPLPPNGVVEGRVEVGLV